MEISEAMGICFKKGVTVYPTNTKQVEYATNGIPTKRYKRVLGNKKEMNEALTKTYIFLAETL